MNNATKVRINAANLAAMDSRVADHVREWKAKHLRSFVYVKDSPTIYFREDSDFTLINLLTGIQQHERAAGEWAGMTRLGCNTEMPLPKGVVAIEESIFMGHHYLTIYQGTAEPVTATLANKLSLEGAQ